jgi:hypothetical protein
MKAAASLICLVFIASPDNGADAGAGSEAAAGLAAGSAAGSDAEPAGDGDGEGEVEGDSGRLGAAPGSPIDTGVAAPSVVAGDIAARWLA